MVTNIWSCITRQIHEEIMDICVLCPSWTRYNFFYCRIMRASCPSNPSCTSKSLHGWANTSWTWLEMMDVVVLNVECNLIYKERLTYICFPHRSKLNHKRLFRVVLCILIPNFSRWSISFEVLGGCLRGFLTRGQQEKYYSLLSLATKLQDDLFRALFTAYSCFGRRAFLRPLVNIGFA